MGNVYVADFNNHRIRKVTPQGEVTTIAGNGEDTSVDGDGTAATMGNVYGIVVYDDSTLYFTDENNYIRKIELDNNNRVSTVVGTGVKSNLDGTLDVASNRNCQAGGRLSVLLPDWCCC